MNRLRALAATVPHACTLASLMAGMCGFVTLFEQGAGAEVFYWLCVAAVFDVLDGAVARALGVSSAAGTRLDALSDAICFGALPAVWLYVFFITRTPEMGFVAYVSLFIAPVAVWRLMHFMGLSLRPAARDAKQPMGADFQGLPVPAAALFICSYAFIPHHFFVPYNYLPPLLLVGEVLICLLMLSRLPVLGLKFLGFGLRNNLGRYAVLLLGVVTLVVFREAFFLIFLPVHVLLSYLLKRI